MHHYRKMQFDKHGYLTRFLWNKPILMDLFLQTDTVLASYFRGNYSEFLQDSFQQKLNFYQFFVDTGFYRLYMNEITSFNFVGFSNKIFDGAEAKKLMKHYIPSNLC